MTHKERGLQDGNGSFERNEQLTGPIYNPESVLLAAIDQSNLHKTRQQAAFISIAAHRDGLCDPIAVAGQCLPAAATEVIR